MLVWSSCFNLSLRKRNKQQLKTTTTVNLIKPQVNAKRSPGAYGPTGVRATRSTGTCGCTHTLHCFYAGQSNLSAGQASPLFSNYSWRLIWSTHLLWSKFLVLAQEKVVLRQEMGWMLPSQTGPRLDCGSLNHLEESAPHSPAQAGPGQTTMWQLHPLFTGCLWRVQWYRLLPPGIQVWS